PIEAVSRCGHSNLNKSCERVGTPPRYLGGYEIGILPEFRRVDFAAGWTIQSGETIKSCAVPVRCINHSALRRHYRRGHCDRFGIRMAAQCGWFSGRKNRDAARDALRCFAAAGKNGGAGGFAGFAACYTSFLPTHAAYG